MPSLPRRVLFAILGVAVSTLTALVLAEWVATLTLRAPAERKAAEQGTPWDRRDRLDLVVEGRRADPNWFPAVPANTYLERIVTVEGRRVIPLGGVAGVKVVGCNENGYYSSWRTDEFGFANPAGALASRGPHLFFIGDSFTQGDCLKSDESIVGRVRAARVETVNLGNGGNGPLLELASIREYVDRSSVSYALWMYYEGNDLDDLRRDRANPILARYLDPAFAQGLRPIQDKVNGAVRDMANTRYEERVQGRPIVFPSLRQLVWEARNKAGAPRADEAQAHVGPGDDDTLELFLTILRNARDEIAEKGGQLALVYLPEYYRYGGPRLSGGASRRNELLQGARALGIPVIDIDEVFRQHADPVQFFPFRLKGHYNSAGTKIVADEILRFLSTAPIQSMASER